MNVVGNKILVETALGTLVVCTGGDVEHPEIFVDLHREGFDEDAALIAMECDQGEDGAFLQTSVWRAVTNDDSYFEPTDNTTRWL